MGNDRNGMLKLVLKDVNVLFLADLLLIVILFFKN